jgi:SAM-dependent methyltransferase
MKSTERFSSRVDAYREHRPRYPRALLDVLRRECGLTSATAIADVAAGTGLLAEIFLENGNPVVAVEPNASMRAVCEELCSEYPMLRCVDGTAEATGLAGGAVEMVTVGQAMHWFDLPKTRAEFVRILSPGGWCAAVYNHRRMGGDGFHEGYEWILAEFGDDYRAVQGRHLTEDRMEAFFFPAAMQCATLPNHQDLTLEGLEGRVLSSSYMPQEGHPKYASMMDAVRALFAANADNGVVRMEYECTVCYGRLR